MILRCFLLCFLAYCGLTTQAQTLYRDAMLLPMSEPYEAHMSGWMLVSEDGFILDIGSGTPAEALVESADSVISLEKKIVMPGFVSGHSHLWQSAFRGIAPDGELWPWLEALHWTYGDNLVDGDLKAFTAHGAWDQLLHGVTATYNHTHWMDHNYALFIEQFEAEQGVPQRFVFSTCVNRDDSFETWKKQISTLQEKLNPTPAQPLLSIALNLRPYGSPEFTQAQVKLAEELDLKFQLHYLEQSSRQESERANWPKYKECGINCEHATYAHFIHTDDTILKEAAQAGSGMVWNPLSNGRLGSGLAEIEKYLEHGLAVGMGVDGQASADTSDPFQNMRMGLYATRMREEHSKGLQPMDMLRLHTIDTAKLLGIDTYVGSLEAGKFADFIVIDPNKPISGPVWDVAAHLVFACSASNIETVYVGGKAVVKNGDAVGADLAALADEVDARIMALKARHEAE